MFQFPKFLLSLLILATAFSSVVSAQDNPIGSWKVTAETPEGDKNSIWKFSGSGDEITGKSISEDDGSVTEFEDVKIDGNELTVGFALEAQGMDLRIEIKSLLSGESFEGDWTASDSDGNQMAGGTISGEKIAKPKKKMKKDLFAGQWDSIAVLPDGTESASVVSLERSNGKLSGFMNGDNGKTTFDDVSVSGKTILLAFTLNRQGNEIDIEVEAELQDDGTLDGEWILLQDGAEGATGKWTATRKDVAEVLFDGKSLENFRGYKQEEIGSGWKVEDGVLHFDGSGGGDIITKKEFENFELTFDWKVSEGGNSGVMYRVTLGDNAPYMSGVEYQILDNDKHADGKNRTTSTAALYALYAPGDEKPKAVGNWNTSKIVANGNDVEHWLNGVKVVEAEFGSDDWNKKVAESKFATWKKFAKSKKGHIALQDHGDKVWYRNIKIKSMD